MYRVSSIFKIIMVLVVAGFTLTCVAGKKPTMEKTQATFCFTSSNIPVSGGRVVRPEGKRSRSVFFNGVNVWSSGKNTVVVSGEGRVVINGYEVSSGSNGSIAITDGTCQETIEKEYVYSLDQFNRLLVESSSGDVTLAARSPKDKQNDACVKIIASFSEPNIVEGMLRVKADVSNVRVELPPCFCMPIFVTSVNGSIKTEGPFKLHSSGVLKAINGSVHIGADNNFVNVQASAMNGRVENNAHGSGHNLPLLKVDVVNGNLSINRR